MRKYYKWEDLDSFVVAILKFLSVKFAGLNKNKVTIGYSFWQWFLTVYSSI